MSAIRWSRPNLTGCCPTSPCNDQNPQCALAPRPADAWHLKLSWMSSASQADPGNRVLAALPKADLRRLLDSCEIVELRLSELIYSPWQALHHVYFPTSCFISLLMPSSDSATFEVALVGNEGMLGIALALNADISPERATVLGAGLALRMDAAALRQELARSTVLRREIERYVHVRMGQLAQAVVCAHYHSLEGRVARRLLMVHERARSNTFNVTQETLAAKLGVRRAGVTGVASSLQHRRLIRYTRGSMTVLDRRGLMLASCSCYKADRISHSRILGAIISSEPG